MVLFFFFFSSNHQTFNVPNMPPNTTRHTMHWGTALPLTPCSNKAEGHSSCQSCSQRLAWRTNGGLFSVRPPPCCPARPRSTRGGQRRCVCRCLVHWYGKACAVVFISFSTGPRNPNWAKPLPNSGNNRALMLREDLSPICPHPVFWIPTCSLRNILTPTQACSSL